MSKVYIKLYSPFVAEGRDFAPQDSALFHRTLFSPNNINAVSMVRLRVDGTILLVNEASVGYDFTISRNRRVLAVLKYRENSASLTINNNWLLTQESVQNREIHQNADLFVSNHLNFEINDDDNIVRVDIKIDDSGFAAMVFSMRDLLFIRLNGNHAVPRLMGILEEEGILTLDKVTTFLETNPAAKETIWQRLFRSWFFNRFL